MRLFQLILIDKYHNSIILNLFLMMILLIFQDRFDENGVYVLNDLFENKHCQKQIFCHKKYNRGYEEKSVNRILL